jgi:hypothetical protein
MILNLTQHAATAEQAAAGVVDLEGEKLIALKALLTFNRIPSGFEVQQMARAIARLAADALCDDAHEGFMRSQAMIGGAPYLMGPLEMALEAKGIHSLFAFSQRVSVEEVQADGTVRKINTFRHEGFVPGLQ